MQNFCFRVVIFFVLRKVGFRLVQACDFPIVWKILILLVFWCRITNYFLVDFALSSFADSLTCVWLHRFRSFFRLFFQLSLYGHQPRSFSLLLLESYRLFGGVFLKIFYTPSLLLESFKTFVGVFLKKFIKISHRADFGCFDFPAFMLETSTQKLFSSS